MESLAVSKSKRKTQDTLKIEIEEEAFARIYGYQSHPILLNKPNQKIAVKVVSQSGEESLKVLTPSSS